MISHKAGARVRQSVALPSVLVEEVRRLAAPELQRNLNGIVIVALQEFVARRRREEFENAMAEMARDLDVTRESREITNDFRSAEGDGLTSS